MNNYTFTKRLGHGKFGVVHLAKHKKDSKEVVVKEKGLQLHFWTVNCKNQKRKNSILVPFSEFWLCLTRFFDQPSDMTLEQEIRVSGLNKAERKQVGREFSLLSSLIDESIVR